MKILFVVIDYLTTPLSVLYLSSIAKKKGLDVDVDSIHLPSFMENFRNYKPDIVAYSLITGAHKPFLEINKKLKKEMEFKALFGGPHCTFYPEVIKEDGVDGICRGEGEEAFIDYLGAIKDGKNLYDIPNWWFKNNGEIIENPLRPVNENLDSIPFPDRDLFLKFKGLRNEKTAFVITSRGCPYNCSYCFNHAFREIYQNKGKTVRFRSVDNVIEEINEIKEKLPVEMIIFQDDTFNLNKEWLKEFSEKYKDKVDIPYHCHLRANLVTEDIAKNLKDSGCISVKMAIETADDELRNDVLKRGITKKHIVNACNIIKKNGIHFLTQNILAIPGGSLEKDFKTVKLNMEIKPDYLFATLMQVYPKTQICEYAKKIGVYDGETSALPASFFHKSVLKIKDREKIERLRMLFPLIVEFPFLYPLAKILIKIPLDPLYTLADKLWKGYCIKHRIYPYKLTLKEYFNSLKIYFKANYY